MSGESKSRLVKAAGAELWREAHFQVKMYKTAQVRSAFCTSDVEKLHAGAVARSTFSSQNVQNTSAPKHFLKFPCQKIARHCGAKHVCKSNCSKTDGLGAIFEVPMSKNCTQLWREAHLSVKMCKTPAFWHTF